MSGVTFMMDVTPVVFCAVKAVTALMPNTPFACMVLRSACIPAPPDESLPAMVRTGASWLLSGSSSSISSANPK